MIQASERREDALIFAAVGGLWVAGSMVLMGPIGILGAALTMMSLLIFAQKIPGAIIVAGLGAVSGVLIWGPSEWVSGPFSAMLQMYKVYLTDDMRWNFAGLFQNFVDVLTVPKAWLFFMPLGVTAGGIYWVTWQVFAKSPLKASTQAGVKNSALGKFLKERALQHVNEKPAATADGTTLGIRRDNRKTVDLSDRDANKHMLVLGTVGSGKTISILNLVESAIQREMPVVYVDGKGDYDLGCQVMTFAKAQGRPSYLFAMGGESCIYNPLASGGFSAKKDRIIELREWSEDHYREMAEGFMQLVFKVLEACDMEIDLVSVAEFMSFDRLVDLINEHQGEIDNPIGLLKDIEKRRDAEKDISSLREQVWNLAESEIGYLFDTVDGPEEIERLNLLDALEDHAVVYFCLPALEFPQLANRIGKLVINDLKSSASAQLSKPKNQRLKFYTIFDEFSVFAGDQVLNLINQGRGAGVHAVLATQSVSDLGRGVSVGQDHFIRQTVGNCNNFLIHRLNEGEDVQSLVESFGTRDHLEHTRQVDMLGSTGLGSARQTKTFQVHPDEIKGLSTGEAVFVNKNTNTIHHLFARHSMIDRRGSS